jgi:hypothetical protein
MNNPSKVLELNFTTLEFFTNYVISQPCEGRVLGKKEINKLQEVCVDHFKEKEFIYISLRVNEYNVQPTVYLDLKSVKNLAGIAVVSKNISSLKMATFEKSFCKIPFEIFMDLDKALVWVKEILENKKADL